MTLNPASPFTGGGGIERHKAGRKQQTKHDMKKKATAKEKKSFARRFSLERWTELCRNDEFCAAFDSGDLELAALIASR